MEADLDDLDPRAPIGLLHGESYPPDAPACRLRPSAPASMAAFVSKALLIAFSTLVLPNCVAQESEAPPPDAESPLQGIRSQDPRFGEAASKEAQRRLAAIRAEASGLPDPHWAGEYYSGDGMGVNQFLSLAPESGFVFEWHGCLGIYDRNWGDVVVQGDTLHLQPSFTNDRQGFGGTAERFRWVQWGERTYLLPDADIAPFCNGLNDGGEPYAMLEKSDLDHPMASLALLPDDIRSCVLANSLTATLVEVMSGPVREGIGGWSFREVTGTIDRGTEDGVFGGMILYLGGAVQHATVLEATPESATVRMIVRVEDTVPRVGTTLGSRPPWKDD